MRKVIRPTVRLRAAARLLMAALIVLVTVIGVGAAPNVSYAQGGTSPTCIPGQGLSGDITLFCIPAVWNGDLVVYAHGFVGPDLNPLALPEELNLSDPTSMPALLLANGYAFATTSYQKKGYAVKEGGENIDALVVAVKGYLQLQTPPLQVKHTYLVGPSYGGLIVTMLAERDPTTYNGGALAMCAPLGGAPDEIKYLGDFGMVFQYFFKDLTNTLQDPTLSNDDRALLIGQALSEPKNARAVRQLFSVTDAAFDPRPKNLQTSIISSTVQIMFYSTPAVLTDLSTTAGGNPYDNWTTRYRGSLNDRLLNDRVKGVTRTKGDPAAMAYIADYYTPKGNPQVPIVTLHNLLDPVVPYKNELTYAQLAYKQHSLRSLRGLISSNLYGHCNFKQTEIVGALGLLGLKFTILPQP